MFQSTHPVWGGTSAYAREPDSKKDFNPPTPCGVGHSSVISSGQIFNFNPPTPCGVGRIYTPAVIRNSYFNPPTPCGVGLLIPCPTSPEINFNPPTPCGVGRCPLRWHIQCLWISIHPPRVGWDDHPVTAGLRLEDFNPPTPCGVGRITSARCKRQFNFNPPTPCGVGQQKFTKQAVELLRK